MFILCIMCLIISYNDRSHIKNTNMNIFGFFNISVGSAYFSSLTVMTIFSFRFTVHSIVYPKALLLLKCPLVVKKISKTVSRMVQSIVVAKNKYLVNMEASMEELKSELILSNDDNNNNKDSEGTFIL